MKLQWADLAVATLLVGAGYAVIYAGLTRAVRRAAAEQHRDLEQQLNELAITVKALQGRVAELGRLQEARAQEVEVAAISAEARRKQEEVKPEIVVALTAAATAFLGKKVRIHSAQLLPAKQPGPSAWAQQGRVFVQTSRNLRSRG